MSTFIDEVNQRLQADGGRMTAQRRIILATLQTLSGHPTVDQIYASARQRDPLINRSTVYRTLRWLEKEQLLNSHHLDDRHQDRFDLSQPVDHHHFRCRSCGSIVEFRDPKLDEIRQAFEQAYGCQVEDTSLIFTGLCVDCKA